MKKLFLTLISLCFMASAWAVLPTSLTVTSTAGGLSSAIKTAGGSLTTVTTLTVTGTIDAKDFKMMRDSMPSLSVLDLSNVDIASYTGTRGPYSLATTIYPANTIPAKAFWNGTTNTTLTSISFTTTLTGIGEEAFAYCSGLTGSLAFPPNLVSIDHAAFSTCTGLTGMLEIPETVERIGEAAFNYCIGLSDTIRVSSNLISLGEHPFGFINASFYVDSLNPNYSSEDGVLFNKMKTLLIQCPANKVGEYSIPSTVTHIGYCSFEGCDEITKLNIPATVNTIGGCAFWGCTALTDIYSYNETPLSIDAYCFYSLNKSLCNLHVPSVSLSLYQSASGWKYFESVAIPVTNIYNKVQSSMKVFNSNDNIIIENLSVGQKVEIYTMQGTAIYSNVANSNNLSIPLNSHGMYLVRIGTQSMKIIN